MALTLRETLPPGRYIVVLPDGEYCAEKRKSGEWFFIDGTGWSKPMPDTILEATPWR